MPKAKSDLLRRSRHVLCYWQDGRIVFENYAAGTRVLADAFTCSILDFFDRWRPARALARRLSQFTAASLQRAVKELVKCSLLERSGGAREHREVAMDTWRNWNPAAGFFHLTSKDVPFVEDPATEARILRERARKWAIPSPVKRYPRAKQIPLPRSHMDGEFTRVLLSRRTWRQFSSAPVPLGALSELLRLTWGVQRWMRLPVLGRLALKTSPSGGARHPIEVYILALRVAGLPRGLYHYAAGSHRLELVKRGASARQALSFLPGQPWFARAAALMLMTAVFPRCQWKYRTPRAYRAVLLDAGHVCQTFCLAATWLGLAPFCTLALADTKIEKALGVDGITESVIYAAGVGVRPAGVEPSQLARAGRVP